MNQWANEAAIVLVYWNTLRKIEELCHVSSLNVRCHITRLALSPITKEESYSIFFKA